MKKLYLYSFFILLFFLTNNITAVEQSQLSSQPQLQKSQTIKMEPEVYKDHSVPYCLARGISNIAFCWLEIPRTLLYQWTEIPIFGLFSGAIYAPFLTVWRALAGTTDIITLGLGGGNVFFAQGMTNFPWQGPWFHHPPPPPPPIRDEPAKVTITTIPAAKTKENKTQSN